MEWAQGPQSGAIRCRGRCTVNGGRVVVGISGGGRTLANLLAVQDRGAAAYAVVGVFASTPDSKGLALARERGLPVYLGDFRPAAVQGTARALYDWATELRADWLALAGFLKLLPLDSRFVGRIVNIHPALLPAFGGPGCYGDKVHRAVLAAGVRETGATVHFVTEHYDEGQALAQITVPVLGTDDSHSLAARVFAAECQLYPYALNGLVRGDLPLPSGQPARLSHLEP